MSDPLEPVANDPAETFVDTYLRRLGIDHRRPSDLAYLRTLHSAHLHRVPFENLSIHLDEPISLDPTALATKILTRHRGGFCYWQLFDIDLHTVPTVRPT